VLKNRYILNWEENRQAEIKELTSKGILPAYHEADQRPDDEEALDNLHPFLSGVVAGLIDHKSSAREIVDEMVDVAVERLQAGSHSLVGQPKL